METGNPHRRRPTVFRNRSPYPSQELIGLIRLAWGELETGPVEFEVSVTSRFVYDGRAMTARFHDGTVAWRKVRLWIGSPRRFPETVTSPYLGLRGAPVGHGFPSWREGFVFIAGHELAHCEQQFKGLPINEVDAEWSGVEALRRYQRRDPRCLQPGFGGKAKGVRPSGTCLPVDKVWAW